MRKTNSLAVVELSDSVTVKSIAEAFSKYETKIVSIKIKKVTGRTGSSRRVANVEFSDVEATEAAVSSGEVSIDGAKYKVFFAKSQSGIEKVTISDKKLYIRGIPKNGESDLTKMLGDCKISTTKGDSSVLFAEFDTVEEQEKALEKLSGMEIDGRKVRVSKAFEKVFKPKPRKLRE